MPASLRLSLEATRRRQDQDESFALIGLLRACSKNKDLVQGSRIHEDILHKGLLEKCSNALITMYAKCGALTKAKELFDMHKSRDVLTWTALIAGHAHKGEGHDALHYFEQMQDEGLSPDAVTFTCILKACGSIRFAAKGEQIHDEIAKQGLLGSDVMLGAALVDMYVKCGALAKAQRALDELPARNVASWTTLISGYAQQGDGAQALICYERMKHDGLSPNVVTYTCILKACAGMKAMDIGAKIHDELDKQGLLRKNIMLGNALIDMYAKCGALEKAQRVLEELPVRNVVSWNALITGYAQWSNGEGALNCLEGMRREGLFPDAVTFTCILKACGSLEAVDKGERIHDEIAKQGLLADNIVLGNALIDMYTKCGAVEKAQRVLEELSVRNVISWSSIIAGYAQQGKGAEALKCFEEMQGEGISPDAMTYACLLKACGSIRAAENGEFIHYEIAEQGLLANDIVLGNALVDMYVKCGNLGKAQEVLEELPARDVISWNSLIAGYVQHEENAKALKCFEDMQSEGISPDRVTYSCILQACGSIGTVDKGEEIHEAISSQGLLDSHLTLGNSLVDMYAKCGALTKAREVLEELPVRDVVSWNALISGHIQHGENEEAVNFYEEMQCEGLSPDASTFTCVLQAYGSIGALHKGEKVHDEINTQGLLETSVLLGNALVDMYAKCGAFEKARQVLKDLPARDAVSWNALISAAAQQGKSAFALDCFHQMRYEDLSPDIVTFTCILQACGSIGATEKGENLHLELVKQGLLGDDLVLRNALVDMYAKCGALTKARRVLEESPVRDVISWNALIMGYAQQSEGANALDCYESMKREGLTPDMVSFTCLLKACGTIGAADKGEKIHEEVAKQGLLQDNLVLANTLVDMYAKCGALRKAQEVLRELHIRDVISWNALISGYAQQCEGEQALKSFKQMQCEGLSPDVATFSCVLCACSSSGLLEDAQTLFRNMSTEYGVKPNLEHHTCMVDLFGRAGQFDKAVGVLERVMDCDIGIWSALLVSCRKWGDVDMGRWAFEHAVQLDKNNATIYVVMASIYAAAGMQEDAENIEAMGVRNKAWEKRARSWWIDESRQVHVFHIGDSRHGQANDIYAKLDALADAILVENSQGLCWVSPDITQIGKKDHFCAHCEKLALVCALINTAQGEAVHVMSNKPLCGDCHVATSLVSNLVQKDFSLRHGQCSCGDHWGW